MEANNDEMFKICFNIFVEIRTVLTQARLCFWEVKMCSPYTLSALLLLLFFSVFLKKCS